MMQRHTRAADFLDECFRARLEFFEIGRTERRLSRAGKNQIRHFKIADRAIVSRGVRVDFLRDSQ
jgi:hypothetical protein